MVSKIICQSTRKDVHKDMHTKLTHFKILEYSFLSGIISSNVCVVLNRNFHSNVNVLGRVSILSVPDEGYSRNVSGVLNLISTFYHKHFLTSLYRSTLFDIFLNPDSKRKYLQVWRIYYRNLSVQRSCLQYTSQCKINPHQLSSFSVGLDTGITVGLIPGSIWKMSCNNLLILQED